MLVLVPANACVRYACVRYACANACANACARYACANACARYACACELFFALSCVAHHLVLALPLVQPPPPAS